MPSDGTYTEFAKPPGSLSGATVLRLSGIRKAFPGVQAISDASLDLRAGEIHALVGENGAGKSTLIKILTGVYPADSGAIELKGRPVDFTSPLQALRLGIAVIHQEFTLIPTLSAAANLFLGCEPVTRGLIDQSIERERARTVFARLGAHIDPDALVRNLTVAQQQMVEIARAVAAKARIIVMDEPTAAITPREVERLFAILRDQVSQGISILFVSHRLDEIFAIADRITVMRDGCTIVTSAACSLARERLIEYMVGRPLDQEFPKVKAPIGDLLLEARNLKGGAVKRVSFIVRKGEVLGITGLMGAGRTEVARLIFGADSREGGEILLEGNRIDIRSPRDAIGHGICLLTEDRKAQGLVLVASARDNFSLPNLKRWHRLGFIRRRKETARFVERVKNLNIRVAGPDQPARDLSGGNQQKLLLARWLETDFRVIIFDEPTRGIDVGAKCEVYLLINELAALGKAVIIISSELPEIIGMCDRVLVMRAGEITGEIDDMACATQAAIMAMAT